MAKCAICDKTQSNGNKLSITRSHISKRSPRTWKPNLQKVRIKDKNGKVVRVYVSTRALRTGLKNGSIERA